MKNALRRERFRITSKYWIDVFVCNRVLHWNKLIYNIEYSPRPPARQWPILTSVTLGIDAVLWRETSNISRNIFMRFSWISSEIQEYLIKMFIDFTLPNLKKIEWKSFLCEKNILRNSINIHFYNTFLQYILKDLKPMLKIHIP